MAYTIAHQLKNRIRFERKAGSISVEQADKIEYLLERIQGVLRTKIYERTGSIIVFFEPEARREVVELVKGLDLQQLPVPEDVIFTSARKMNAEYVERLQTLVLGYVVKKAAFYYLVPLPVRFLHTLYKAGRFFVKGLRSLFVKRKLEVSVLDAVAIAVSIIRGDYATASSVMFLLEFGETLEEWTHKKSVAELAQSLSLNIKSVWIKSNGSEIEIPMTQLKTNDLVIVRMGQMVPVDGLVHSGEAMINQASLTGESLPVAKSSGSTVFAGTVLEEGEVVVQVTGEIGASRYERIVTLIEDSENLKSSVESRAEHLADSLVPYSFAGFLLTFAITRSVNKALSFLMVDFSCALKLAMPVAVLSAMRECSSYKIYVKGGKFLEAVADAKTVIFDKTGTLTKAEPRVADIITFEGRDQDEMLRLAACLEEHFPHSIANAVVRHAEEKGLSHRELHTDVEYIVAHGIASSIYNERILIGSSHFIFNDEKVVIPESEQAAFDALPLEYSHLYLAIGGRLAAVICIADPIREEALRMIPRLRKAGIERVVMLTGDSERTARVVAEQLGVDEYRAEVLPEDKAGYILEEKRNGKVIMVGDGINDSLALSVADVGIAMSEGAEITKQISDITLASGDIEHLVTLKQISNRLMKRISRNYRGVVGFNSILILLGVLSVITPNTSALLHNLSTIGITADSTKSLLPVKEK